MNSTRNVFLGDMAILLVSVIWGVTNVVIRNTLSDITPFWFCVLRFLTAWLTLMLIFGKRAIMADIHTKIAGGLTGCVFIMAYLMGAMGLLYTTAGNQSFIISMSVVFVPMSVWILTKKFPGRHVLLSVLLCTAGMAGLMLDSSMHINRGDVLSFISMLFITVYILLVQRFAGKSDVYALSCWQSFGGLVLAFTAAVLFEPIPKHIAKETAYAILYAGTIAFALTLVLQTWAQKHTTSTHTAILLSTSGFFGSAIGIMVLGEPMTCRILISSLLIFLGVAAVEIIPAIQARSKTG